MELNDSSYSIDYLTDPQLGDLRFNSLILDNLIPGLLTLFGAAIVLRQPDLGTAAIVCAPLIPMLLGQVLMVLFYF